MSLETGEQMENQPEIKLLDDGTLWIKTDIETLEKISRVIIEDGQLWYKEFYQDSE